MFQMGPDSELFSAASIFADLSHADATRDYYGSQILMAQYAGLPPDAGVEREAKYWTDRAFEIRAMIALMALGWPVTSTNIGVVTSGESGPMP
jgi:hypothetical protein